MEKKWYVIRQCADTDRWCIVELTDEERAAVHTMIDNAIVVESQRWSGHFCISKEGYSSRQDAEIVACEHPANIWDDFFEEL